MMIGLKNLRTVLGVMACAIFIGSSCYAVPAGQLDSSNFDYRYEMDLTPNNQDLDGNGADDWWDVGVPSVASGIASGGSDLLYRSDFGNAPGAHSIWRANFPDDGDYTVEVSVRVLTTGAEGSRGSLSASFVREDDDSTSILYVSRDGQAYNTGVDNPATLGSNDNTDGFHVFRVAREGSDLWIWRDSVLLNPGGLALLEDSDVNGATGLFVGDTGSATAGDWELDYIRITPGAFAPVPEPATAGLIGMGALMLIGRRRRRASHS